MKVKFKRLVALLLSALQLIVFYSPLAYAEQTMLVNYGPYTYESSQGNIESLVTAENAPTGTYAIDHINIKLRDTASSKTSMAFVPSLSEYGISSIEPIFMNTQSSRSLMSVDTEEKNELQKWYVATLSEDIDPIEALKLILQDSSVESAELDYYRQIDSTTTPTAITEDVQELEQIHTTTPSSITDPRMSEQWYLGNVKVAESWDYLQSQGINPGGSRDVVVAVIDTGVDSTHPDLMSNMWINTGEIPGNDIDDDGNGYVDDINGASTVGDEFAGESGVSLDDHGHGTHVAGVIAASANDVGITGIAYNTQIMSIKAAQSSGVLTTSDIAEALYYAVDKGADVINMSFGGYGQNQLEEDALAFAFGHAVLVAAAGNDSLPNVPYLYIGKDMFPAAYPWVVGVMAEGQTPSGNGDYLAWFSNWDFIAQDSHEYEVMAPGDGILSTLPNGEYGVWSGTSMAAPVVSGIAALLRSKFSDNNAYSSRFIMGQLVSTGDMKQGITYSLSKPPIFYHSVNAFKALTETPKPRLSYLEHYIFDLESLDINNNGNGVVDAGEVVDLGIVLRNHWGKADNVQVTINTKNAGGFDDPYVTLINDTVNYGAVGNFSTDDNGLIYENDIVVGVENGFKIKIADDTPNDHRVPINITFTCSNGLDNTDITIYTYKGYFDFLVRRGNVVPSVISEDLTLTKDKYWIIPNATLVEEGAILTIEAGTKVQFWSSESEGPYADKSMAYIKVKGTLNVNGTAEEPVEMFTSGFYEGYEIKIFSTDGLNKNGYAGGYVGNATINYAKIMNPNIAVNAIDHCYFTQAQTDVMYKRYLDNGIVKTESWDNSPIVYAKEISNSIFDSLGNFQWWTDGENIFTETYETMMLRVNGELKNNLFDSCIMFMDDKYAEGNVFLKNYKLFGQQHSDRKYITSQAKNFGYSLNEDNSFNSMNPVRNEENGSVYFIVNPNIDIPYEYERMQIVQKYANALGGYIATVNNEQENQFLAAYLQNANYNFANIGLSDYEMEGQLEWINGEDVTYTNYGSKPDYKTGVMINRSGGWSFYPFTMDYPTIIEIPNTQANWTQAELNEKRMQFIQGAQLSPIKNNAILNRLIDPDTSHWMRVMGSDNGDNLRNVTSNYWGTDSELLINKVVLDFNDYMDLEKVIYKPYLTTAPEECYPFVTDIYVTNSNGEVVTEVGAETIQIHAFFNRDMDQSIQPQVNFGPDLPTTDYTVNGVWLSERHWVGETEITPLTGDGTQYFRVARAVAASDPWLVTGDDSERFAFEIITSGTEAMNLQATGGENKVTLTWTQNDFDLLAGFNIYRSDSKDGIYTKINSTLIPSDQKTYEDLDVTPGKPYFYKFTVVKTDLSESDFSNVASATPIDTVAPVISHTPVNSAAPGLPLQIYADVTDNVRVDSVTLYYRISNKDNPVEFKALQMINTTNSRYSASLEGSNVVAPGIEYYIEAFDGSTLKRSGRVDMPYFIQVTDAPKITSVSPANGPASGGANVVITGSNFKENATVTFGNSVASNIFVKSPTRITATTPVHIPDVVDVKVTNSDGYSSTLLRGYRYESDGVEVSIPDLEANIGQIIEVPINISNVDGLLAADVEVLFNSDLLLFKSARKGNLTSDFSFSSNEVERGKVRLSLASSAPAAGTGTLAVLELEVLDSTISSSELILNSTVLNGASIKANAMNGMFNLMDLYEISGYADYYKGLYPLNNVEVKLEGYKTDKAITASDGIFKISGVERGDYKVAAAKADEAFGISAYDASLILQYNTGNISLSTNELIAADVDKSGAVNSMDASYVLQKSVDMIALPFPGAGGLWTFVPKEMSYFDLHMSQLGVNFTGILLGDVSGNWNEGSGLLNISNTEVVTGDIITDDLTSIVPVGIENNGENTYALDLVVSYDPLKSKFLTADSVESTESCLIVSNEIAPGTVKIAIASNKPISSGKLLDLKFTILIEGALNISVEKASANERQVSSLDESYFSNGLISHFVFAKDGKKIVVPLANIAGYAYAYSTQNELYQYLRGSNSTPTITGLLSGTKYMPVGGYEGYAINYSLNDTAKEAMQYTPWFSKEEYNMYFLFEGFDLGGNAVLTPFGN